jgi:hypothetical protein
MSGAQNTDRQEQGTYLALISGFVALAGAFTVYARKTEQSAQFGPLDIFLLSIATYRAGKLIASDTVAEPLRQPFTTNKGSEPDAEEVEPRGQGVRRAIGTLLSCSTCIGTWAATFLVYGLKVAPLPTRAIMVILAAAGVADITEKSVGALSMIAQAQQGGKE